jgi:hypothetical protein
MEWFQRETNAGSTEGGMKGESKKVIKAKILTKMPVEKSNNTIYLPS